MECRYEGLNHIILHIVTGPGPGWRDQLLENSLDGVRRQQPNMTRIVLGI